MAVSGALQGTVLFSDSTTSIMSNIAASRVCVCKPHDAGRAITARGLILLHWYLDCGPMARLESMRLAKELTWSQWQFAIHDHVVEVFFLQVMYLASKLAPFLAGKHGRPTNLQHIYRCNGLLLI